MSRRLLVLGLIALTGCTTAPDLPRRNVSLVPTGQINLTPTLSYTYEKLAMVAAGLAVLYVVYDPLAPNWAIEEGPVGKDRFLLSMKMKRFHNGGDGEAMLVFKRRAAQLMAEQGAAGYEIAEFVEGIESSTPVAQRFAQGIIRLTPAPG